MTPSPTRVVILDLGNVLVFHDNALLCQRLAERTGGSAEKVALALSGPLAEAINRGALDGEGIRREVCRVLGGDIPRAEFFDLWSSHFTPYEEMVPRVEALARRARLVLLSNTNVLHWDWLRPRLPVLDHFDVLLTSFELGVAKPDAAIFRRAVEVGGAPAEATAFFDDVPGYVEAARKLGINGQIFTTAETFDDQVRALGI
jgi:putative hydrolase of the HAD superfamily